MIKYRINILIEIKTVNWRLMKLSRSYKLENKPSPNN